MSNDVVAARDRGKDNLQYANQGKCNDRFQKR